MIEQIEDMNNDVKEDEKNAEIYLKNALVERLLTISNEDYLKIMDMRIDQIDDLSKITTISDLAEALLKSLCVFDIARFQHKLTSPYDFCKTHGGAREYSTWEIDEGKLQTCEDCKKELSGVLTQLSKEIKKLRERNHGKSNIEGN